MHGNNEGKKLARKDYAEMPLVSSDPEHPCYNLHLANARLFKQPIEGVKGKLGIFEYPDII